MGTWPSPRQACGGWRPALLRSSWRWPFSPVYSKTWPSQDGRLQPGCSRLLQATPATPAGRREYSKQQRGSKFHTRSVKLNARIKDPISSFDARCPRHARQTPRRPATLHSARSRTRAGRIGNPSDTRVHHEGLLGRFRSSLGHFTKPQLHKEDVGGVVTRCGAVQSPRERTHTHTCVFLCGAPDPSLVLQFSFSPCRHRHALWTALAALLASPRAALAAS